MVIELVDPTEPPSVFIHVATGEYPVFDQNIRDRHPELKFLVPITAEAVASLGYAPVLRTRRNIDCCSFVWRRSEPGYRTDIGYYENWTYEPAEGSIHQLNKPSENSVWDTDNNIWTA